MTKNNPEYIVSIGHFDDFTEADFEAWLKAGLEAYLLEGAGAWAFPGADGEIAAPGNLFLYQGLCESYRKLTAEQRKRYRRGLANVLASLEPSHRNVPIFEHLLSLASALPAPEILRVLPALVGNGYFGLVKGDEEGDLFALTLLTVARFAGPRPDVLTCLNELIRNSRHFDIAYSGIALEALCRADPEGFLGHMAAMRKPLGAMFQEFQVADDVKRGYAVSILDAIGLSGWCMPGRCSSISIASWKTPPWTVGWCWLCLTVPMPLSCASRTAMIASGYFAARNRC